MKDQHHPSEDWHKELEETPLLRSLERASPFQAPEGYFEKLAEELQLSLEDQREMEQAPALASIPKLNVFQAPRHYFEQLPDQIVTLIEQIPQRNQPPVRKLYQVRYMATIAAGISLLVLVGIWLRPSSQALELSDIPVEELMAVIELENIPTETIMEIWGGENLLLDEAEIGFPEEDLSELLQEMEEGELEDMLLGI